MNTNFQKLELFINNFSSYLARVSRPDEKAPTKHQIYTLNYFNTPTQQNILK